MDDIYKELKDIKSEVENSIPKPPKDKKKVYCGRCYYNFTEYRSSSGTTYYCQKQTNDFTLDSISGEKFYGDKKKNKKCKDLNLNNDCKLYKNKILINCSRVFIICLIFILSANIVINFISNSKVKTKITNTKVLKEYKKYWLHCSEKYDELAKRKELVIYLNNGYIIFLNSNELNEHKYFKWEVYDKENKALIPFSLNKKTPFELFKEYGWYLTEYDE